MNFVSCFSHGQNVTCVPSLKIFLPKLKKKVCYDGFKMTSNKSDSQGYDVCDCPLHLSSVTPRGGGGRGASVPTNTTPPPGDPSHP